MAFTSTISTVVSDKTVTSGQTWEVVSGGVMSGTTIDPHGAVVGFGGVLSAGTSLTVNEGLITTLSSFGYLAVVGNVSNTDIIQASAAADSFSELLLTGGTAFNSGGTIEAVQTGKDSLALMEVANETVLGGTLLANGSAAQLDIDGDTISGATLSTTGDGALGVAVGLLSGVTPVSTTVINGTIAADSLLFDDGLLIFSGGKAQAGVKFADTGSATFDSTTFGAGDYLLAISGGALSITNSTNVFSANTTVEASEDSSAVLSGGLANSGTIWALATGLDDAFAGVTISAGGAGVTNAKGGLIEAETVGGYFDSASVAQLGSGALSNSGTVEAYAFAAFDGTASVVLHGSTVSNSNLIEALAISSTDAAATVFGADGVTNSGTVLASATNDATAELAIYVSGGTVTNTRSIEALAPKDGEAGLVIQDLSGSASLVNSHGAIIEASANDGSELSSPNAPYDGGLFIDVGSGITNAGTIAESVSDLSSADHGSIDGGSLVNTGTVEATATNNGSLFGLDVSLGSSIVNSGILAFSASDDSSNTFGQVEAADSGGVIDNSSAGSITAAASDDSYTSLEILAVGSAGAINNSGSMTATATAGSTAYVAVEAAGAITNRKTIEASATGAGSTAYMGIGGYSAPVTVNNSGGTLEATAAAGASAFIDLGDNAGALVVGGTLKTTGADAAIGAFGDAASATSVTIAADSNIVAIGEEGSEATLTLNSIVSAIAPGTLVEAAYGGTAFIDGGVANGGTIEALGGYLGPPGPLNHIFGSGVMAISAGTGAVANSGDMVASAALERTGEFFINAATVSNSGLMTASGDFGVAFFTIRGTTGSAVVSNTGTMAAVANDRAYAGFTIDGGVITNTKTMEALQEEDSYAGYFDINGSGSGSTVTNSGTMLVSTTHNFNGSDAGRFSISGGTITNAAGKSMEALGNAGESYFDLEGLGSGGSATGNVYNSGTMVASAANDGGAYFSIDGGTIVNAANAKIQVFVTSSSDDQGPVDQGINLDGVGSASTVSNAGAVLASATLFSQVGIDIFGGGTIVNATSGTIEGIASDNSEEATVIADSGGTTGGVIDNYGTILGSASDSSRASLTLSNASGTIVNTRIIEVVATDESFASAVIIASSTVNSGTIEAIGGADSTALVNLDGGTVANSTSGLISASGDGVIVLDGATIVGGTLRTSGSEAAFVVSGGETGEIESATIAANTNVDAAGGGTLTLGNGDVIATGATVQALASGNIDIAGGATVTDLGTLLAGNGGPGTITVSSGGVVDGLVTIGQDGVVNVLSGGSGSVLFAYSENNGALQIADTLTNSASFTGAVYGFGGAGGEFPGQLIELVDVPVTGATLSNFSASFSGNGLGGELIVTSGGTANVVAEITLSGYYVNAVFDVVSANVSGGVLAISDPLSIAGGAVTTLAATTSASSPAATGTGSVALLGSYMASLFASTEGQVGAQTTAETAQSEAVITHPHAT